ncbi:MAG: peroxiredoxin [Gallionellales bacterium GWA2_59_43]|nr:MAG: peroxiredoxin [Gallionellales bacterium GWA2_59_43]
MQVVQLTAGMEAPHFELPDADMENFVLTSLKGKRNVVLYFYPRDDTPGCTLEANEFSNLDDDFAKLDTIVVGISRDDCLSHASFRDKHGLSVLLLSDPEARVCKRYGVMVEKEACTEHGRSMDGHRKQLIQRSTFVIDRQGKLRHVLYGVHAHGHAQEILNLIKEMK